MGGAELNPSQEAGLSWAKCCQPQCGQSGLWGVVGHCFLLSWAQQQGEPATESAHHHDCRPKSRGEHPLCVKRLGFCTFWLLILLLLCILIPLPFAYSKLLSQPIISASVPFTPEWGRWKREAYMGFNSLLALNQHLLYLKNAREQNCVQERAMWLRNMAQEKLSQEAFWVKEVTFNSAEMQVILNWVQPNTIRVFLDSISTV